VSSEDGAVAGCLTTKLASKGKVSVSGKLSAKTSVSGTCSGVLLDSAFVETILPDWSGNGDVLFAVTAKKVSKQPFVCGLAFCENGQVLGDCSLGATELALVGGSEWNKKQDLTALNGATVSCGAVSVTLTVSGKKVAVSPNDVNFKFSVTASAGTFKGSFKKDGISGKYEGALFVDETGRLVGFGGGSAGKTEAFSVSCSK